MQLRNAGNDGRGDDLGGNQSHLHVRLHRPRSGVFGDAVTNDVLERGLPIGNLNLLKLIHRRRWSGKSFREVFDV